MVPVRAPAGRPSRVGGREICIAGIVCVVVPGCEAWRGGGAGGSCGDDDGCCGITLGCCEYGAGLDCAGISPVSSSGGGIVPVFEGTTAILASRRRKRFYRMRAR